MKFAVAKVICSGSSLSNRAVAIPLGKIEEALTLMKFDTTNNVPAKQNGEFALIYVLSGSCNRNY